MSNLVMQAALFVKCDYDIYIQIPHIIYQPRDGKIACHHQEGPLIEKTDILVALVMIIIYDNNYTKLFLISQLYFLPSKSGSVNLSSASSIIVFKKEFNIKISLKVISYFSSKLIIINIITVLLNCLLHP